MRAVPLIVGAIFTLAAPLVVLGIYQLVPRTPDQDVEARAAVEGLQEQVAALQLQVEDLRAHLQQMEGDIESINAGNGLAMDSPIIDPATIQPDRQPNPVQDAYADLVLIADRAVINQGTEVATPSFLEGFLGRPRAVLSDDCEPMENPKLAAMLVTAEVGNITVQMLQPAVDSLTRVMDKIKEVDTDLYESIGTAGSLCVRRIRGTIDRTSSHSFGLAVDLTIAGRLAGFADGKTQLGLTMIQDIFRTEGWAWGAGFGREDSMHFEVSRKTLEAWRAEGKI
jgi:hypothetical protein